MRADLRDGPVSALPAASRASSPAAVSRAPSAAAPPPGRATMRDVAVLAGVSLKTASRVVNGAPTVDADLAARVRRAAAQLNYRHNLTSSLA